jgi:adenylate kinase
MLKGRGRKIDLVIELKVDDAVLIGRVEQRIKESGGVARADDTPETLKNRLAVYYKNTAPLIEYYKKQGKLVTVDGMAPIEEVTKAIAAVLDGAGRKGCMSI